MNLFLLLWIPFLIIFVFLYSRAVRKEYRRRNLFKKRRIPVWCPKTRRFIDQSVVVREPTKR